MEKQKTRDIRLIDAEPPEHIRKIRQILTDSNIPDDEFVLLVAGKKDEREGEKPGFNMFSGYFIGSEVDKKAIGRAFFSDLMLVEEETGFKGLFYSFLLAASDIIKSMREGANSIINLIKGEVPHGDA